MTTERNVYQYWQKHHKGEQTDEMRLPTLSGNINALAGWEDPQPGLWKIKTGGGYLDGKKRPKQFALMQVWLCRKGDAERKPVTYWEDGLELVGDIDGQPVSADVLASRWVGSTFLTKKEKTYYFDNEMRFEEEAPPATDNSNDLTTFEGMCAQIRGEIFEATRFFAENPIASKALADRAENYRGRIAKLGKQADELKKAEKRPLQDLVDAVEAKWKVVITEASSAAMMLKGLVDTFDAAERKRIREEAEAAAKAKWEAEQKAKREAAAKAEEERKAAEAENARRLAEHQEKMADDPIAALSEPVEFVPEPDVPTVVEEVFVAPVVDVPKALYGTGTEGNRRSAKEPAPTAIITDLKAAALFYAEQNDPDLIKLIQKLADKAAKARATVPGITMQKAAA
ncbi:hypothetical protein [Hyphomicrobium sp. DY-1]|uniref:hypothetical protein n=1 Tax=Hyphomicrobium sp. DY-1 TaxID=3075650 RepID=UPI0039C07554